MISASLSRELNNHFLENGRFEPFLYTIGLEASLDESAGSIQNYPIPLPVSDEKIAQFIRSLTFYHEATHLCQFVSTAYGLRALRFTLICLRNISRQIGWDLPLAAKLAKKFPDLSENEWSMWNGCLNFLDISNQLTIKAETSVVDMSDTERMQISYHSWSPHYYAKFEGLSTAEFEKLLKANGAHIRKLPQLMFRKSSVEFTVVINGALLMENFAVLVEMNHIENALGLSYEKIYDLLPKGNEYHCLIAYMLESGLCSWFNLIPTLTVLIDASLMYDPFILYNVPWDAIGDDGKADQYPGETFMILCEALKKTSPIQVGGAAEIESFYKEVCLNAGLPDPDWMAQKSLETISTLIGKQPDEKALMHEAVQAHYRALKLRVEKGCGEFLYYMPTSDHIIDLVELSIPAVSFYNLTTHQPDRFDPQKIDLITIHSILFQAITQPKIECPLKMGNPFFCESAVSPSDKLCTWKHEFGRSECYVDILEKKYNLIPS